MRISRSLCPALASSALLWAATTGHAQQLNAEQLRQMSVPRSEQPTQALAAPPPRPVALQSAEAAQPRLLDATQLRQLLAPPAGQAQVPPTQPWQPTQQVMAAPMTAAPITSAPMTVVPVIAAPAVAAPQRPAQGGSSEAALARLVSAWPRTKGAFAVERFRDGFAIAGERVLDPEGRIVLYSVDAATGNATYLVQGPAGQMAIKMMRFRSGAPLTIATASRQSGLWSVDTISGLRVAGSRLTLAPTGFIVARDNALFHYVAGEGLRSYGLPETHTLAAHQNGDISTTGWVLLEKRQDTKERQGGVLAQGSVGQLFGAIRSLGATLGVNKADTDYALYQLGTDKTVPIGIALSENQINILSQCRQKNRWVATCDRAEQVESLYGQDGYPNRAHYFWRITWFNTPRGAVALVMEDGITKIDAIELGTDRRATVFQRSLGIGDWSTSQSPDGRVVVKAQLGFESARNDDVAGLFGGPGAQAGPQ